MPNSDILKRPNCSFISVSVASSRKYIFDDNENSSNKDPIAILNDNPNDRIYGYIISVSEPEGENFEKLLKFADEIEEYPEGALTFDQVQDIVDFNDDGVLIY